MTFGTVAEVQRDIANNALLNKCEQGQHLAVVQMLAPVVDERRVLDAMAKQAQVIIADGCVELLEARLVLSDHWTQQDVRAVAQCDHLAEIPDLFWQHGSPFPGRPTPLRQPRPA